MLVPQDYVLRALDRPARTALELSRRNVLHTISPAIVGLMLLAACELLARALAPSEAPGLDFLRAALESMAVVVPGAIVLGTWLRLRVPPRMLVAAVALGLLMSGVVCASFVPLVLFLAIVSSEAPDVMTTAVLLVPALCVAVGAATVLRVVEASDASMRAWFFARAYVVLLLSVFSLRFVQVLGWIS